MPTSLPTVTRVTHGLLNDSAKTSCKFDHMIIVVTPPIKEIFKIDFISSTIAFTEKIFLSL